MPISQSKITPTWHSNSSSTESPGVSTFSVGFSISVVSSSQLLPASRMLTLLRNIDSVSNTPFLMSANRYFMSSTMKSAIAPTFLISAISIYSYIFSCSVKTLSNIGYVHSNLNDDRWRLNEQDLVDSCCVVLILIASRNHDVSLVFELC